MQLLRGAKYFFTGFSLILKPNVKRFMLIPLAINIALFALVIAIGYSYTSDLILLLTTRIDDWIISLPGWLWWLGSLVSSLQWIIWPLFVLSLLLFFFFFFSMLANLIAAPFNGFLAEAVEQHLTGNKPNGDNVSLAKETILAMTHELRKIGYFLLRAAPLLLLFVIPVINVAAPFLWLLFTSWMLAVEYIDYPMSNHRIAFKHQQQYHKQRRGLSLGFGAIVAFANSIPLLNFIVMPIAVAGATALYCQNTHEESEQ
ncbi:MAG: sulfate transporter CysZ [Gammaproteobacteria bacterium]|nr:sulfate transporter CysZ [Gammaproteobacteria bacterium]